MKVNTYFKWSGDWIVRPPLPLPPSSLSGVTIRRDLGWAVPALSPRFSAASSARGEGEPLEFVSSPTHRRSKSGSSVGRRGSKTDSDSSLLVLDNGSSVTTPVVVPTLDPMNTAINGSSWGELADTPRSAVEAEDVGARLLEETGVCADPQVRFLMCLYGLYSVRNGC